MKLIEDFKRFILNNSIKNNLLSLYSIIVIIMSFLFLIMLFYSIELNHSYNKIILNFENYNRINFQVNSIDKDIYLNITEQKKFDEEHYNKIISGINKELSEIDKTFDDSKSIALVEVLKRTVNTLSKYINKTDFLIKNNANYIDREEQLNNIIHTKEIIEVTALEIMEFNLTASQKHINAIKSSYNIALCIIIILFFIALIASVCFLLFVIRDTVNKIHVISDNANKLASGDLSIDNLSFSTSNEFQILAHSFNKMKNNINDYINTLHSSEMRTSSILNTLNDCIITTNLLGEIDSCNSAIQKIFNYPKDAIVGENINKLISAIDFSRYEYDKFNNQQLIKNGQLIDDKYQLCGEKKDGTTIPIEVSYNEVEINGQRIITFVIHDITEHKQLEKMKDEFVSVISHELRTPLTSIRGSIGLIISGILGNLPDKINELLKIANNNCIRLTNLINDILDMEKIKAGKMSFNIKEYNVVPIVKEAIEANCDYAKQYKVEYKLTTTIESAMVNVDKDRLIQALLNLLSNAAKFSYANSIVDIGITKINDNKIRINVQDKGIGMSEEFKNRVFNRFLQADSSDTRKKGGTGLGLCITKELINNMGGQIGFESKLNEGTNFYIDFLNIEGKKERIN